MVELMRKLRYHLVDVFTNQPFGGNQLAVFTNGRGIPAELMQSIARELNLSETTFVLPPKDTGNDFWVRIFTPATELPIAGHPTVGTAFVLAHEQLIEVVGNEQRLLFEEGVGVIPVAISLENDQPAFIKMTQPLPEFGSEFEDLAAMAQMLAIDIAGIDSRYPLQVVSCGVSFLFVPIKDLATVRQINLRLDLWEKHLKGFEAPHLFVFTPETETKEATVHARMFAPALGIAEDPATGAASGPLGCYLVKHGLVPTIGGQAAILSEQGFEIGRPSFIHIEIQQQHDGQISGVNIKGECVHIGEGYMQL
jgi:trans-2,3-dihydro-3-hydroxyanthranilate isomerase